MSPVLPLTSPEAVGLSQARLGRIGRVMEKHISAGRLAGGLGLIARRGKIGYFESYGGMPRDTIFRIFSMTKAITGVAAMMLFEEGAFALADPIAKFIPEFGQMKVGNVLAQSPITVLDLMRHTAGFNYIGPRDEKGELIYQQRGLQMLATTLNSTEFIQRLSEVPLLREPGTAWDYGFGTDVLGCMVEIISGQTLEDFFSERILQPLNMHDTGFYVPEEKRSRLAPIYQPTQTGTVKRIAGPLQDGFHKKPSMFMGGAGLTSTTLDYLRFVQMLLNGGELDGVRLLSPMTVELMRSDLLGDLPVLNPLLAPGHGFGITVAVSKGQSLTGTLPAAGQFRWGGAAGTAWWVDPREQMVGLFMMQTLLDPAKRAEFMQLAYQAIVD